MAVNKVQRADGTVELDVSGVTAAAEDVVAGKKFVGADGVLREGTIPSKSAATYTPKTTNQTIAAGQYLTGAQTIAGDANLVAANIVKGKSIFGVAGSAAVLSTLFGRKYEVGTFTLTSSAQTITFTHGLGVHPSGAIYFTSDLSGVSMSSIRPGSYVGGTIFFTESKGYCQWFASSSKGSSGYYDASSYPTVSYTDPIVGVISASTTSNITLKSGGTTSFFSGVTYHYILLGGF